MSIEEGQTIEDLKRLLKAEQEKNAQLKIQTETSQSSPKQSISPRMEGAQAPSQLSTVQYVQNIAEPTSMLIDDDVEEYLAYFETVYESINLSDSQKIIKLISKLPRHHARYIQSLLRGKPNFAQVKEQIIKQYGVSVSERQRRFETMQYIEGKDIGQFILLAEQQLVYSKLPSAVVAYKIYEKLPFTVKQLVSIGEIQDVQQLLEKVRKIEESNVLQLLTQSLRELKPAPMAPSYAPPVAYYESYGRGYTRRGRGRGRWSSYPRTEYKPPVPTPAITVTPTTTTQNINSEQANQQQKEVQSAIKFQKHELSGFCEKVTEDECEAFVQTRARDYVQEQQGTSQCKQEEPSQANQELEEELKRRKRRNQQEQQSSAPQQQNTYERQSYSQASGQQIVFGQSEVCDSQGRVNLSGLLNRIEIQLPLSVYLGLANQELVTKDINARPINIYTEEIRKQLAVLELENDKVRMQKIVVPVKFNNKVLQGIVDTGAEYTLISTKGAYKAGVYDKINKNTKERVRGVSGVTKLFGNLNQQSLYIGSAKIIVDLAVLYEQNFEMLIGRDILFGALKNLLLDSQKRQIEFQSGGQGYIVPYTQAQQDSKEIKENYLFDALYVGKTLSRRERLLKVFQNYTVHKKYNFFYGDLPWVYPRFHTSQIQYQTQKFQTIQSLLPIADQSEENAILLLWARGPKIPLVLRLMQKWGFKYKTILLCWCKCTKSWKPVLGLGYWTRSNVEVLLMASKGCIASFRNNLLNVQQYLETVGVKITRKGHSEKPELVYPILKDIFDIRNIRGLELFAKKRYSQNTFLDIYGDQIPGYFDEVEEQHKDPTEQEVNKVMYSENQQNKIQEKLYVQSICKKLDMLKLAKKDSLKFLQNSKSTKVQLNSEAKAYLKSICSQKVKDSYIYAYDSIQPQKDRERDGYKIRNKPKFISSQKNTVTFKNPPKEVKVNSSKAKRLLEVQKVQDKSGIQYINIFEKALEVQRKQKIYDECYIVQKYLSKDNNQTKSLNQQTVSSKICIYLSTKEVNNEVYFNSKKIELEVESKLNTKSQILQFEFQKQSTEQNTKNYKKVSYSNSYSTIYNSERFKPILSSIKKVQKTTCLAEKEIQNFRKYIAQTRSLSKQYYIRIGELSIVQFMIQAYNNTFQKKQVEIPLNKYNIRQNQHITQRSNKIVKFEVPSKLIQSQLRTLLTDQSFTNLGPNKLTCTLLIESWKYMTIYTVTTFNQQFLKLILQQYYYFQQYTKLLYQIQAHGDIRNSNTQKGSIYATIKSNSTAKFQVQHGELNYEQKFEQCDRIIYAFESEQFSQETRQNTMKALQMEDMEINLLEVGRLNKTEQNGQRNLTNRQQSKVNRKKLKILKKLYCVNRDEIAKVDWMDEIQMPIEIKQREDVKELFGRYKDIFSFDGNFKATNVLRMKIQLKPGTKSVRQKQYRMSDVQKKFVSDQIQELLEKNLIFEIDSEWVSPIVVVPKKNGKLRMCIDYRRLNESTVKVRYPTPFIQDIVQSLNGMVVFATIDLISGYWQVLMDEESIPLTSFTCFMGTFACRRMQFGLTNAVALFQKLMDTVLAPLIGKCCFVYLDDIVVYAKSIAKLTENLQKVFELLRQANLTLSPSKCLFYYDKVQILGQVVQDGKLQPNPDKLKIIRELRRPRNVKEVQQFLGLVNYFRAYIPAMAELCYPIQKIIGKNCKFEWLELQQKSFEKLKEILLGDLFLYIPKSGAKLVVQVTVTTIAYSGMLFQCDGEQLQPIQFVSKQLPETQVHQVKEMQELRAVVSVLNEWEYFLQGRPFKLETDVASIAWAMNSKLLGKVLYEQSMYLEYFDFELVQRSEHQLRHLKALIYLNSSLDWLSKLENSLEFEAKRRQLELEVDKKMSKKNPLTKDQLSKFEMIVYTDGACQRKKGQRLGSAAFILYEHGQLKTSRVVPVEVNITNNVCEYKALDLALNYLTKQHYFKRRILIVMDSELVINQVKKIYSVNNEVLRPYYRKIMDYLRYFQALEFQHVPREYNTEADHLCKEKLQEYLKVKGETNEIIRELPQFLEAYNVVLEDELANQACLVCGELEPRISMMLCDHCSRAFHQQCVGLEDIPMGHWYCENCQEQIRIENEEGTQSLDPIEDIQLQRFLEDPESIHGMPDYDRARLRRLGRKFTFVDGVLCYRGEDGLRRIPTVGERALVVKQIHQAMGHYGVVKTLDMVRQCYWWPKIAKFVDNIVKKCLLCQANNARYPNLGRSYAIEKGIQPFTHVTIDLFYLPKTRDSFKYVVVAIDSFTKWIEAEALVERDSQTLANWFHREIVCRYGAPAIVRTDNGGEFLGRFHDYLFNQNIQHVMGSPNHPETQGQVERTNETLKNGIRKLFNTLEYRDEWPWLLPQVLLGIRTSVSRATRYSPSQLLMGRDLVLPRFQVMPTQFPYEPPTQEQIQQHFETFVASRDIRFAKVYEHLAQMDVEIKRTIDKRRKRMPQDLNEGDMIIIKGEQHNALEINAEGPMVVMEYTDPNRNAIRYFNPRTRQFGKASIANVKLLTL